MLAVNQNQKRLLRGIAKKFKLKLILAFGSAVEGKTHPASDLDIAVLCRDNLDSEDYLNLIFELEKVFPEQKIDLVLIHRADPLLLHKISQSFLCLYGSNRELAEFLILAFKRYQDYRPFFRLEEECVTSYIQEG